MIHADESPHAGKTLTVAPWVEHHQFPDLAGSSVEVEDWWDRVSGGKSWMWCDGNPACLVFAMRTGFQRHKVPMDDEVVYAKYNGLGVLLHVSELEA